WLFRLPRASACSARSRGATASASTST
ncbi:MAG: RNA polymerase sigma factor SigB, partial [uncultured Nocardioidaceae bacterium]